MPLTQREAHGAVRPFSRNLLAAVLTVLAAGVAAIAIAQTAPPPAPPTLQAILPQDSAVVGGIQFGWLWSATASIRAIPSVADGLSQAEKAAGLSFDTDVVPWVGEIGVSTVRPGASDQQIIVYAQIRDTAKFTATVTALQASAQSNPDITASTRVYKGDTICEIQSKKPGTKVPEVSYAFVNGWALAGIGAGAIEHALDVYNGRSPSLQGDPAWLQVFARLPAQPTGWLAYNVAAIVKSAGDKIPAGMSFASAETETVAGMAFNDEGNGYRTDIVTAPVSSAAKAFYVSFANNMHPLTGEIGRRVPDGVVVCEMSNPAFFWHAIKLSILAAETAAERKQMQQQLATVDNMLQYFHKDAGIVITWRKDRGYGLVALAQADTHVAAVHTGASIAATLKQSGAPIVRGGNSWSISMPGTMPLPVPLKVQPFMSAKDDWLVVGSHPMWTALQGTPTLAPPSEAGNAASLFLLSMQWLPSALSLATSLGAGQDSDASQAISLIRGLHLENSVWSSWSTYQPDGTATGVFQVTNWDWHTAIDNAAKSISNWKSKPASPKGNTPNMSDNQLKPATSG